MPYIEEREFTLRFELECRFPEDYEGEADGYAWAAEWPGMASEMLRAVAAVVAKRPGWTIRPGNRGRSSDDEVTLVLERAP